MRFLTTVSLTLALAMFGVPLDGVAQSLDGVIQGRSPLTGLTVISAPEVQVVWNDNIEGKSEAQYTQELERAFELELLRMGLKIGGSADGSFGSFVCSVMLVQLELSAGTIVMTPFYVTYREAVVPLDAALQFDLRTLGESVRDNFQMGATWLRSGINASRKENLSGADMAKLCAEYLESDWRRANN